MGNNVAVFLPALIVYAVIVWGVGYWAVRNTRGVADFAAAKGRLGTIVFGVGTMAALASGWAWVGMPGAIYAVGYAPRLGALESGMLFGIVVGYFGLAVPMRILSQKYDVLTIPDAIEIIYESKLLRILVAIGILMGITFYAMAQWAASGWLLSYGLGVSFSTAVLIAMVLVGVYIIGGGMLASMYTNAVQVVMMLVGSIIVFAILMSQSGGFTGLHLAVAEKSPHLLNWYNDKTVFTVGYTWSYFIMFFLTAGGQPGFASKFIGAKNLKVFRWSLLIIGVTFIINGLMQYSGLWVRALVDRGVIAAPAHPDQALFSFMQYTMPLALQGVIMAAVVAATLSTLETFFILSSTAAVRDIWQKGLGKQLTEKQALMWMRIVTAIILVGTGLLALKPPALLQMVGAAAWGMLGAVIFPPLFFGLRWKRTTKAGAFASVIIGLGVGGVLYILQAAKVTTFMTGVVNGGVASVLAIVALVVVSLLTPHKEKSIFAGFKKKEQVRSTSAMDRSM